MNPPLRKSYGCVYYGYRYGKKVILMKFYKSMMKYFAKYPDQNAFVHLLGGVGIGFLLTYPAAGAHPVRWGLSFIALALVGYLWAGNQKVK
jgi:hypothetical protein